MNHEFWYLSRAAGFTAYVLLFAAAALGIAISTRFASGFARRNLIFDLHRFVSILALAFSAFHVYVLLRDGYFNFNVWQLSLPFLSPYRTWQVAAGVFGLYAMAIVVVSFYIRRFIGYRTWRALHYLTFAMYAAVTLHGIAAGTDTGEPWARMIYLLTGGSILVMLFYRLQVRLPDATWMRAARAGSAVSAVVVAGLLVTRAGLFAGTSGSASVDLVTSSGSTTQGAVFLSRFTDSRLTGTFQQTGEAAAEHLTLEGSASGDLPVKLAVDLVSQRTSGDERSSLTRNSVRLLDPRSGVDICDGSVTGIEDNVITLRCAGAGAYAGVAMTLTGQLNPRNDGTFTGTLTGSMQRSG